MYVIFVEIPAEVVDVGLADGVFVPTETQKRPSHVLVSAIEDEDVGVFGNLAAN